MTLPESLYIICDWEARQQKWLTLESYMDKYDETMEYLTASEPCGGEQ